MLQVLTKFWERRWNKIVPPTAADWTRILNFVQAFVPPVPLTLPPITLSQWESINSRYKATAASGPDGFDRLDLQNMAVNHKQGIISMLNAIECGAAWPQQLLQGFGICIPKHGAARHVSESRPIIILSMVYRSWTALRSRAILQHLGCVSPDGVKGFLPHREAGDVWHFIQMMVEVSMQQSMPLSGAISDVTKAFESIPRSPLIKVALRLGLPRNVLLPWERFLNGFQRRFLLHDEVGPAIASNHGLPEGDVLSVVGMAVVDLCSDYYQTAFAPRTLPISYVDNYEVLAAHCGEVLHGFGVLEEYMHMWHLELSSSKTFFWSTSASDRATLRRLGKNVTLQIADLGGAMTFCRRRQAGSQLQRLAALDPLWQPLRRVHLPLQVKAYVLRQALWCRAFYAIGISLLPWREVQQLRTKAVRALGHGGAGASPAIRLCLLADDPQTDRLFSAARLNSLREGPFVTSSTQGRFDMVKAGINCPSCGVPDTWEHRALHCERTVGLRQRHREVVALWSSVPKSLSEHVLPSRNPFAARYKRALLSLPDMTERFHEIAKPFCCHDLFSDGSCLFPTVGCLSLAAWSVVSATHGTVLASGPVHGLLQTVDRAELLAAYSAIRWTLEQRPRLFCGPTAPMLCRQARASSFQECHAQYERAFYQSEHQVDLFRAFHLDFASQHVVRVDLDSADDDGESLRPSGLMRAIAEGGDWPDALPLGWQGVWSANAKSALFPLPVLQQILDWLHSERERAEVSVRISWLELTAMLEGTDFGHPLLHANGASNVWGPPHSVPAHLHRPLTVAARVRFLADLFRAVDRCFGVDIPKVQGLDLSVVKVHPPQRGTILFLSAQTMRRGEMVLSSFTSHRPVRTANDLARPFIASCEDHDLSGCTALWPCTEQPAICPNVAVIAACRNFLTSANTQAACAAETCCSIVTCVPQLPKILGF
eukprot:s5032_g3.t1